MSTSLADILRLRSEFEELAINFEVAEEKRHGVINSMELFKR